jgi:polyisoprenyl-teichoic acid--peptidoglycan teichoic acid transferase
VADAPQEAAAPPRPRRSWPRRLLIAANIFVALCVLGTAAGYAYFRYQFGRIPTIEGLREHLDNEGDDDPGEPMNVLLVGSDSREGVEGRQFGTKKQVAGQRSDTIIVLRIDPKAEKAAMLSIPRDLYVQIPGLQSPRRINVAFETGGPGRLIQTINDQLGIPIDHYAQLDFQGFQAIVDAVGGVPVYFEAPARDKLSNLRIDNPGCVKLDGGMALSYVRSRHYEYLESGRWRSDPTGDLGRIQRQQDFVRRVVNRATSKAKQLNVVAINRLVNSGIKNVKLDETFSSADVARLARRFRSLAPDKVEMLSVPIVEARVGGAAVLRLKQPDAQQVIDRFLGKVAPAGTGADGATTKPKVPPGSVTVRVLNGSGVGGQGTEASRALREAGFGVAGVGAADSYGYVRSVIRYGPGQIEKARLLQGYLKGGAQLKEDPAVRGADIVLVTGGDYTGVVPTAPAAGAAPTTTAPPEAKAAEPTGPAAGPPC